MRSYNLQYIKSELWITKGLYSNRSEKLISRVPMYVEQYKNLSYE